MPVEKGGCAFFLPELLFFRFSCDTVQTNHEAWTPGTSAIFAIFASLFGIHWSIPHSESVPVF